MSVLEIFYLLSDDVKKLVMIQSLHGNVKFGPTLKYKDRNGKN